MYYAHYLSEEAFLFPFQSERYYTNYFIHIIVTEVLLVRFYPCLSHNRKDSLWKE